MKEENDDILIAGIEDFSFVESEKEEKDLCPECRGEEKFQHHEMPPSPFKDRKFIPPKEKS